MLLYAVIHYRRYRASKGCLTDLWAKGRGSYANRFTLWPYIRLTPRANAEGPSEFNLNRLTLSFSLHQEASQNCCCSFIAQSVAQVLFVNSCADDSGLGLCLQAEGMVSALSWYQCCHEALLLWWLCDWTVWKLSMWENAGSLAWLTLKVAVTAEAQRKWQFVYSHC